MRSRGENEAKVKKKRGGNRISPNRTIQYIFIEEMNDRAGEWMGWGGRGWQGGGVVEGGKKHQFYSRLAVCQKAKIKNSKRSTRNTSSGCLARLSLMK